MGVGVFTRGICRLLLAVVLIGSHATMACALTAFEYRAAGLSIAVDVPGEERAKRELSNVMAVSGKKAPESLLVDAEPEGRWRVLVAMALVPVLTPYRNTVGLIEAAEARRELSAGPRGGSLVISYRSPDGQLGLQLRVGSAGTLHLSYDRPKNAPDKRRGVAGLGVEGIEYVAAPSAVPVPPALPLLGGALLALVIGRRRS